MIARLWTKRWLMGLLLAVFLLNPVVGFGAGDEKIDWDRARQLRQRQQRGETLTAEEKTYLDQARQVRRRRRQEQGKGPGTRRATRPAMEPRDSMGLVPLTDMTADDKYKGQDGGLYGRGQNRPPEAHRAAALRELAAIRPLDADGNPSPGGKIVLISIGMSNTRMEYQRFIALAAKEKGLSVHLVIVDCAHGGLDINAWNESRRLRRRGNITIWEYADQQLAKAGVTGNQVQVAWGKQAKAGPASDGEFPAHAEKFSEAFGELARLARSRYPNLRVMYLSSRIYAGYAKTRLNPEPYAYENAFSLRWLIERQIAGSEKLNYDPARGAVVAPLLLWGPYLWADGIKGRKIDDLLYKREDLAGDGTHPSDTGRQKVAGLLLRFFKTDPLARTWFLAKPETSTQQAATIQLPVSVEK